MNIIQHFISIFLFIVFVESSDINRDPIKKLFEDGYNPVTVLLSDKNNRPITSPQISTKGKEDQGKESNIEGKEIGTIRFKDLYEKIVAELPDASLSIDKWSKLKFDRDILSNTLEILQDFPKLDYNSEIQGQIYLDISQFIFKCILYEKQETRDSEKFKETLDKITEKYNVIKSKFGSLISLEIANFYDLNSKILEFSSMSFSDRLVPEILERGDELFKKFDSILNDFYKNKKSCKEIENKWFNERFLSKPILALMTVQYDNGMNGCFIPDQEITSNRWRIGDIKSVKRDIIRKFDYIYNFLTKGIFEFYKDNKIPFKINSSEKLYEFLYVMDKLGLLSKENLEKHLMINEEILESREEFEKYLEKGKDSGFGKLVYEKVKDFFKKTKIDSD